MHPRILLFDLIYIVNILETRVRLPWAGEKFYSFPYFLTFLMRPDRSKHVLDSICDY